MSVLSACQRMPEHRPDAALEIWEREREREQIKMLAVGEYSLKNLEIL